MDLCLENFFGFWIFEFFGFLDFQIPVDTANTLTGWEFDLHFDAGILNAVDVSEGSFFSLEEGKTFFQKGEIDNKLGH